MEPCGHFTHWYWGNHDIVLVSLEKIERYELNGLLQSAKYISRIFYLLKKVRIIRLNTINW